MHINSNDVYGQCATAREEMMAPLEFCGRHLCSFYMLQFYSVYTVNKMLAMKV